MPNEKWSAKLKETAQSTGAGKDLHVVLELNPSAAPSGATRAQRIQAGQSSFAKKAQPIKEKIETLGGKITGETWLNSTIAAEVPPHVLEELGYDDDVKHLDVPGELKRDS